MSTRYIILAKHYKNAQFLADQQGLPFSKWSWATRPEQLRGIEDATVFVYNTGELDAKFSDELRRGVALNRFRVFFVREYF